MDHSGASEGPGPGRRPSSPSSWTPMAAKGQAAQSGQRSKVKITPFHSSPIVSSDGAHRSKRPGAASGKPLASPGSLFADTPARLTAPPPRERLAAAAAAAGGGVGAAAAAAGSSEKQTASSDSVLATTGEKARVVKVNRHTDERLKGV